MREENGETEAGTGPGPRPVSVQGTGQAQGATGMHPHSHGCAPPSGARPPAASPETLPPTYMADTTAKAPAMNMVKKSPLFPLLVTPWAMEPRVKNWWRQGRGGAGRQGPGARGPAGDRAQQSERSGPAGRTRDGRERWKEGREEEGGREVVRGPQGGQGAGSQAAPQTAAPHPILVPSPSTLPTMSTNSARNSAMHCRARRLRTRTRLLSFAKS